MYVGVRVASRRTTPWSQDPLPEIKPWKISRAIGLVDQVGHGFPRVHGIEEIASVRKTGEKFHSTMGRIFRRQYTDHCDYSAHNREVCGSKKKGHVPDQEDSDLKRDGESGSFRVEAHAPQGRKMGLCRSFTLTSIGNSELCISATKNS